MAKNDGRVRSLPGIGHQGTEAFKNKATKSKKKSRCARKARRKNRSK